MAAGNKRKITLKIGMVGDPGVGKTSLMVKYVENKFDPAYLETLGVNFMEKHLTLPQAQVTMSVWDLGGSREFSTMIPMVVSEAAAMLFVFDLTSMPSLSSVKKWFKQVRGLNKAAQPYLVGAKFDLFYKMDEAHRAAVTAKAKKYADSMKAPVIFCSAHSAINVQKLFKVVFCRAFNLPCPVKVDVTPGNPIIQYTQTAPQRAAEGGGAAAAAPKE